MGCGMSTEEKEGKARNEEIENQLKRDRMQQRNEIKMLLLGTSTITTAWSPPFFSFFFFLFSIDDRGTRSSAYAYWAFCSSHRQSCPLSSSADNTMQVLVNPESPPSLNR